MKESLHLDKKAYAAAFKLLRKYHGKNQEEFGEILGLNRQTIANVESLRQRVPSSALEKLDELGIQKFIGNTDTEEPIRPRATKNQIRILIDLLAEAEVPDSLKLAAKAELYSILDLTQKV